jgi:hypothetical protein
LITSAAATAQGSGPHEPSVAASGPQRRPRTPAQPGAQNGISSSRSEGTA